MPVYDGNPQDFDHLIEEGYEFRMSDYFSRGWEIFKQYWLQFSVYLLIFGIISGILSSVFQVIPYLGYLLNNVISAFVGGALTAGFFIVSQKISQREKYEFSDLFQGFQDIIQIGLGQFVVMLITSLPIIAFFGVLFGSSVFDFFQNPAGNMEFVEVMMERLSSGSLALIFLCVAAIAVYFSVAYMLTIPFIALGRLDFWSAMETSRKVVSRKWGNFFLMYLMFIPIVLLGMLALIIGIIPAAAYLYTVIYAAYEGITGHDAGNAMMDRIDEIGMD